MNDSTSDPWMSPTSSGPGLETDALRHRVRAALLGSEREPPPRLGRYEIIDTIGRGGMGVVHRARDLELDRVVALKVLRDDRTRDDERLRAEARALAKLSHPNVLTIYEVGVADDVTFLALEFVDGPDVGRWIHEASPSIDERMGVLLQVADGLAAAHGKGFVHRDVKPGNILVGSDGRARVADFGLVRGLGSAASTTETAHPSPSRAETRGGRMGTVGFMAPEQMLGESATAKSDQFSFFVTMVAVLAERLPFGADDIPSILERVEGEPHGLGGVPARLRSLIRRGLSPDPAERFASMAVVAAKLRARQDRPKRRRRIAAVALAGFIPSAFALWQASSVTEPCEDAGAELGTILSTERSDALRGAFSESEIEDDGRLAALVEEKFVGLETAIAEGARSSCTATRLDETQSEAAFDLRSSCFGAVGAQARSAIEFLAKADRNALARSEKVVEGLHERLRRCNDIEVLRRRAPPPELDDDVARLRSRLGVLETRRSAGQPREIGESLANLENEARDLGFKPVLAEVLYVQGRVALDLNDGVGAEDAYGRAVDAAEASGQTETLAEAWLMLAAAVGEYQSRPDDAAPMLRRARAVIEALGDPIPLQLRRHHTEGRIALTAGHLEEARAHAESMVSLSETGAARRPDRIRAAMLIASVERMQGRPREALPWTRKALELLGDEGSPIERSVLLHSFALALDDVGELDASLETLDRAEELERTYAGTTPALGNIHGNRAAILLTAGRLKEARTSLQAALEVQRALLGDHHSDLATTTMNLAGLELHLGNHAAALTQFEAAEETMQQSQGEDSIRLAQLRVSKAEAFSGLGRREDALRSCGEALQHVRTELAETSDFRLVALTNCGKIIVESDVEQGLELLREASRSADSLEGRLEIRAQARLELARALVQNRRRDEGLEAVRAARSALEALEGDYAHEFADLDRWQDQLSSGSSR